MCCLVEVSVRMADTNQLLVMACLHCQGTLLVMVGRWQAVRVTCSSGE
jgi:hypothetical protein